MEGQQFALLGAAGGGGPVPASKRITRPLMTKYERARILGARALQISYAFPRTSLHSLVTYVMRALVGRGRHARTSLHIPPIASPPVRFHLVAIFITFQILLC